MIRRRFAPVLSLLLLAAPAVAQPHEVPNAAQIELDLKRLNVVGGALYVAAHPDDENTALLSYWAREKLVRAAYLSMTRGDGGQNLIGKEKGDLMGLIRTQELLAARRVDGARQLFTRAVDFGYTKSPEEALDFWGKDAILADTVWAIRRFRPDVIVTRFPTTGEGGHGHHTASARLAEEAFKLAADPNAFPEQLASVKPWQAKRLLWNAFRFGANAQRDAKPGWIPVDLGTYNALLGRSYTEIAAVSRSMHKSQGFGSAERRGTWLNDFEPRLGDTPTKDVFEGVDLTWARVPGSAEVQRLVNEAIKTYDPARPASVVPVLVKLHAALGKLPSDPNVDAKREETLDLIRACSGLWLEAMAADFSATPGSEVKVAATALNRSDAAFSLESVAATHQTSAPAAAAPLANNQPVKNELVLKLPETQPLTNPYWLAEPHGDGGGGKAVFTVKDRALIGLPVGPAPLSVRFTLTAGGERLVYDVPVQYRWTDPVKGEIWRPFEVVPPVTLNLDEHVYLFAGNGGKSASAKRVSVTVRAGEPGVSGTVRLSAPSGWVAAPADVPFSLRAKGDEMVAAFTLMPSAKAEIAPLRALALVKGQEVSRSVVTIDYPHIPPQTLFPPAEASLVRLDLATRRKQIGYIEGSGDDVPDALRQLGYTVTPITDEDLAGGDLGRFETIVAGVRAYNTRPRLKTVHDQLMRYVEQGGTYLVQYTTTSDLVSEEIGPFPFKLSRDRVSVETAPVTVVTAGHPLLTAPNRITEADFQGWVQERGLYFAGTWDPKYETVIASHDPGEPDKAGGLLFARHGKGVFVYTGYSFFRQLPAGVPGAIRLFANLVSAEGAGARK